MCAVVGCSDDEALRLANDEIEAGNETIAALNEQVAQGNATIDHLNNQVAQGNATIRALNAQVALAGETVDAAHAEIVKGNESIVYLQGVIEQKEAAIADLDDAHHALQTEHARQQSDLSDFREAYHQRNAQWIATRWELRDAERQLARVQEQLEAAQSMEVDQAVPQHMVWAEWKWDEAHLDEIILTFEYGVDVELTGRNGLYHMACGGWIDGGGYYFGLQTDVHDYNRRNHNRGKGVIFSRWGDRNLEEARIADDGWAQESGHEGDFIGVRRNYDWSAGRYQVRLGLDKEDENGRKWLGVWVKGEKDAEETWIGSLLFPKGEIAPRCYTTVEIYGRSPIKPNTVPYWKVMMEAPVSDGKAAYLDRYGYDSVPEGGEYRNSLVTVDGDTVQLEVGLDHIPGRG